MKELKELTIKDDFMFGVVMSKEKNCKGLLEMVLGISIKTLRVHKEDSLAFHPGKRGVRLDIIADDGQNTRYDVEMQTYQKTDIPKRSRYYASQIDVNTIATREEYKKLPRVYVIFICDYDPIGQGLCKYTFRNCCMENKDLELGDGREMIVLNAVGENVEEISKELRAFLNFVHASLEESEVPSEDAYVAQLQRQIRQVKKDHKREGDYKVFQQMVARESRGLQKKAYAKGRWKGKREGAEAERASARNEIYRVLESRGINDRGVRNRIAECNDMITLMRWFNLAEKASDAEEFRKEILA